MPARVGVGLVDGPGGVKNPTCAQVLTDNFLDVRALRGL
jgi:hypothetical protein